MNLFASYGWRDPSSGMVTPGEHLPIEILSPKRDKMRWQRAFSLLQLLIELAMTVFIGCWTEVIPPKSRISNTTRKLPSNALTLKMTDKPQMPTAHAVA
jgi:hypothetical protein